MKKSTLNLIHEIVNSSREKGIAQLVTEDQQYNGRTITLNSKEVLHFGSCSYLGLELDERLKQGAIEAIQRYGIQFSCSRSYLACTLYKELETLTEKLFEAPIALSTSTSLGHHGVIPVIVEENDLIILDQQVHSSVQDAAYKMQARNIPVTVVRHNNLSELKKKLEELSPLHERIWYMIDGVYSMYGDFAPMKEIAALMESYPKLHLYADDAHGMSWKGKNGRGYVLSELPHHSRMVVATSFAKAFGVGGGVFIFPNKEICQKVKNCGGPFMFSGPHQIPVLGAAIESVKIHLSEELYQKQQELSERISYCHQLLIVHNLPVVSNPSTPIFFVGLGLLRVGQKMVKKMLEAGFYMNISAFPAVPENCTGVRFTITLHHTKEDIKNMIETMAKLFIATLQEEQRSVEDIYRAFRHVKLFKNLPDTKQIKISTSVYSMQKQNSITRFSKPEWDSMMSGRGSFDWEGLKVLEESFSHNVDSWNNWGFHYYLIKDNKGKIVLATFFTTMIMKDDMLENASISLLIEKQRLQQPLLLTSKVMVMGSMLTTGQHLFIDRERMDWKDALMLLLDNVWKDQDKENAQTLLLRDFETSDIELADFFSQQGFIKTPLPGNHLLVNNWTNNEQYLSSLKHDKRYFIRKRVQEFKHHFQITVVTNPTQEDIKLFYQLYLQVANKSYELNTFPLPEKLFNAIAINDSWEFIRLDLKTAANTTIPVGMSANYIGKNGYHFVLTGMDYKYTEQYNVYPQVLWSIVSRANQLGLKYTSFGITASQHKRKFGAIENKTIGFVQTKDSYNHHLMQSLAGNKSLVSISK